MYSDTFKISLIISQFIRYSLEKMVIKYGKNSELNCVRTNSSW